MIPFKVVLVIVVTTNLEISWATSMTLTIAIYRMSLIVVPLRYSE